jgi:flagellar motor protein MotB
VAELQQQKLETERQTAEAERQRHEAAGNGPRRKRKSGATRCFAGNLPRHYSCSNKTCSFGNRQHKSLLLTLGQQLKDRGVLTAVDEQSGVLHLSGDLLFATGSVALSADAQRTVCVLADITVQ